MKVLIGFLIGLAVFSSSLSAAEDILTECQKQCMTQGSDETAIARCWEACDAASSRGPGLPETGPEEVPEYKITSARYWGTDNLAVNFKPEKEGAYQPWMPVLEKVYFAETFDEYCQAYTEGSRPLLEQNRRIIESSLEVAKERRKAGQKPVSQYFVTLDMVDETGQYIYTAFAQERISPEQAGRPFLVQVFKKVGDEWRIDLTRRRHPLILALKAGQWKQFGGPQDY